MDAAPETGTEAITVAAFRQILLWPVQLLTDADAPVSHRDRAAQLATADGPWRVLDDEFTGDPAAFQERHYSEFVAFLPTVQRFIYGQGRGRSAHLGYGESPITVLRRTDVTAIRLTLQPGVPPLLLAVAHIDLHFFFDIDIAILAVEVHATDLPLATAQDVMFRFGRGYPAYWAADGRASHCPALVELLSPAGAVLAASDYDDKRKYLDFVCRHRATALSAHWRFLLRPMVLDHADEAGTIRYRQLEYYRMPLMAWLALPDAAALSRADRRCLALASAPGMGGTAGLRFDTPDLPYASTPYHEIEDSRSGRGTWYAVSGYAIVVAGCVGDIAFTDPDRGHLGRFRHQNFMAFLIAHFHKAALLMFSDHLADAVTRLDLGKSADLPTFRRQSRAALENFLRFTHRYWFDEVTNHIHTRALFDLTRRQLQIDRLYLAVRQELHDMSQYLEGEAQRRQNTSMVRLTVVTTFGLTAAISTGFLGMNLFAFDTLSGGGKLALFALVFLPTLGLTLFTVARSARLSAALDALSDDSLTLRDKIRTLFDKR